MALVKSLEFLHLWLYVPHFTQLVCLFIVLVAPPLVPDDRHPAVAILVANSGPMT